jgi:hypothetical protein
MTVAARVCSVGPQITLINADYEKGADLRPVSLNLNGREQL